MVATPPTPPSDSVGTAQIADGSIATADLADDAVTHAKVAVPKPTPRVGWYYGPSMSDGLTASIVNNRATAFPAFFDRPVTIDQIRVTIPTAPSTAGYARVGLYADDGNGYPGALIQDDGQFDITTPGSNDEVDCNITDYAFAGGLLWVAVAFQGISGGTPQVRCIDGSTYFIGNATPGDWNLYAGFLINWSDNTSGALPDPWPSTYINYYAYCGWPRIGSVDG